MTAYDDRLMDLDLREVLGVERAPDVWPAVAAALPTARPRLRYVRGRRRRAPARPTASPLTWAAAALLVASIGLLWWAYGGQEEGIQTTHTPNPPVEVPAPIPPEPPPVPTEPFGRVDRSVMLAGTDGVAREGRVFEPGTRLAVGPAGASIRLRDGTTIRSTGEALLALDEVEGDTVLEAAGGDVTATTAEGVLVVREGSRPLRAEPATALRLERLEPREVADPAEWLGGRLRPPPADVLVAVDAGRVSAAGVEGGPGDWILWLRGLEPTVGTALPVPTRSYVDARIADLERLARLEPDTGPWMEAHKRATQSGQQLRERLHEEPAAWGYVAPWLDRLVRDLSEHGASGIALPILVHDPEGRALAGVHLRLESIGVDARANVLLPLAELHGDPVAVGLMRRKVSERTDPFDVYPAVYLALRGDDAGEDVLDAVLRGAPPLLANPAPLFAAAAGKYRLGDRAPWQALRESLQTIAEEAIEARSPSRARFAVLAALHFAPAIRTDEIVTVAGLNQHLMDVAQTLRLETEEDLRRALEQIP